MAATSMLQVSSTTFQPHPFSATTTSSSSSSSSQRPLPSSSSASVRRRPLHSISTSPPPSNPSLPFDQRMRESLAILDLMESDSIGPDPDLLAALLKACSDARNLRFGRIVHDRAVRSGLHNHPLVANNLVLLYARCGLLGSARRIFDEMPLRDVISWTTAISAHHRAGFPRDALDLYVSMTGAAGLRPNAFTCTVALNCCARTKDFELGSRVHDDAVREGCEMDEFVVVALIDMYCKCGRVGKARDLFDRLPKPSVEACTAMIEGYNASGEARQGMDIIRTMLHHHSQVYEYDSARKFGFATMIRTCTMEMALRQGQEIHAYIIKSDHHPGAKALSLLVDLYECCDKMMAAKHIFDCLAAKEVSQWVSMISGFLRNEMYAEAYELYAEMASRGLGSNTSVVPLAIGACVGMRKLEEGRQMHGRLIKVGELLDVADDLSELYKGCGKHEEARKLANYEPLLQTGYA